MNIWIDIIGWAGGLMVLLAYLLVSTNKLNGKHVYFQLLNTVGASLLVVNTIFLKSYPSAFENLIWACVGIVTLVSILLKKKEAKI